MKNTLLPAILVLLAASSPAGAYFTVGQGQPPANVPTSPRPDLAGYQVIADRRIQYLTFIGRPNPEVQALQAGFSDGVPLETAIKIVLPPNWTGYLRPAMDKGATVKWINGATWTEALEQIAKQINATVAVDWNDSIVTVDPLPPESSLTESVPNALPKSDALVLDKEGHLVAPMAVSQVDSAGNIQQSGAVASGKVVAVTEYKDLNAFLNEEIQVDVQGVTLKEAIIAMLPKGWEIRMPSSDPQIDAMRIEYTNVNSRGAMLHELMKRAGLSLFPYIELRKAIIVRPE